MMIYSLIVLVVLATFESVVFGNSSQMGVGSLYSWYNMASSLLIETSTLVGG